MDIYQESLLYHKAAPNGKFSVEPTKPMDTQHDLSLAYSPGVAQPCLEIEKGLFLDFTLTLFYLELTLKFDPEIEFLHSALKFDSVISAWNFYTNFLFCIFYTKNFTFFTPKMFYTKNFFHQILKFRKRFFGKKIAVKKLV